MRANNLCGYIVIGHIDSPYAAASAKAEDLRQGLHRNRGLKQVA